MIDFIFSKPGHCFKCQCETNHILHRQIGANSAENFIWICETCETVNPAKNPRYFIPRADVEKRLTAEQIDELPCKVPTLYTRCAKCGARGTENHHWAPRAMFGSEADKWPQDYLCKTCHDQWHRIVTPQLTTDQ